MVYGLSRAAGEAGAGGVGRCGVSAGEGLFLVCGSARVVYAL